MEIYGHFITLGAQFVGFDATYRDVGYRHLYVRLSMYSQCYFVTHARLFNHCGRAQALSTFLLMFYIVFIYLFAAKRRVHALPLCVFFQLSLHAATQTIIYGISDYLLVDRRTCQSHFEERHAIGHCVRIYM